MAVQEIIDFDFETLPWTDRVLADIEEYVGSLSEQPEEYDLRNALLHWAQFGYVRFPQAQDEALIDAYLEDLEEILERRELGLTVSVPGVGIQLLKDSTPEQLAIPSLKLNDFHNASIAGKKLALNPITLSFCSHIFREPPVMMQSLTFVTSSEQGIHQDFPYVVAETPSHLAASWLALEDIHPDAGPLSYFPGSHTIRKYDWGNGLFKNEGSTKDYEDFERHILAECDRMGLKSEVFCPKKGDIFIWHAALAHGGSPVRDRALTRKSLVSHFSSESGYQHHWRRKDEEPVRYQYNGGTVFGDPRNPEEEDVMTRGADL